MRNNSESEKWLSDGTQYTTTSLTVIKLLLLSVTKTRVFEMKVTFLYPLFICTLQFIIFTIFSLLLSRFRNLAWCHFSPHNDKMSLTFPSEGIIIKRLVYRLTSHPPSIRFGVPSSKVCVYYLFFGVPSSYGPHKLFTVPLVASILPHFFFLLPYLTPVSISPTLVSRINLPNFVLRQ